MQTDRRVTILVIVHPKISVVDLGKEFDESSLCMKFGRNWVRNNKNSKWA